MNDIMLHYRAIVVLDIVSYPQFNYLEFPENVETTGESEQQTPKEDWNILRAVKTQKQH